MRLLRLRAVLVLALSAGALIPQAEAQTAGIEYNQAGAYYDVRYWVRDWETGDSTFQTARYLPGDQVEPLVGVTVTGEGGGGFRYAYTVRNGAGARNPLYRLKIDAEAATHGHTYPDGTWSGGFYAASGDPEREYTYTWEWANTRTAIYAADSTLNPLGLPPNAQLEGFAFRSMGLPAIVQAYAAAYQGVGFYEGNGPLDEALGSVGDSLWVLMRRTEHVPFRTLGPRAVPEPFDGVAFLDTLAADVAEAAGPLGWITDAMTAGALLGAIAEARDRLAAADSAGARAVLEGLLGLAKAGRGGALREEAHALLHFNLAWMVVRLLDE